jgi:SNF2 family DNA or RNA helicase
MIIFHAGFDSSQLLLWGEAPAAETAPVPARRRRRQAAPSSPLLPYDAGATGLLTALKEVTAGMTLNDGDTEMVTAWLPTVNGQPIASSPLIAEPALAHDKAISSPWMITTLPLTTAEAVDLLCACVGQEALAPGLLIGPDLAFWVTAMRFAGALVARQQFLPGIDEKEGIRHARWEPVLAGAEAHRQAQLAKYMPHACRALTRQAAAAPALPAASLLTAFLGEMVDYLVRHASERPIVATQYQPRREFDSIHDQWLAGLRSTDGVMECKTAEFEHLAGQARDWRRPIAVSTAAPFRLCFRLEEPQDEQAETQRRASASRRAHDAWYVRYLLQAADDPSLLLPVADAWQKKGRRAAILQRGLDLREYLLPSLGQAAGICPRIEGSLKTAAPGGYELDTAGAHEFLTEKAWSLEQAGFGVLLPAWWSRKGTKLRLTARAKVQSPKLQSSGGLSLDAIMQFQWEVALGGQKLSLQELETLARIKAPLVKVRGQWVLLNADEIQAALDFWKKKGAGKASAREIVQMALGAAKVPGGIKFEGVTASGWMGDFLAQLEGRAAFTELGVPAGFRGTLRPYQVRGYSWLAFLRQWGLGACLADDMGLGKTPMALTLIQRDWEANGKRPTLVICPMSVVGNWQKEASRFTPNLPVMVHHGLARAKGEAFKKASDKHAIVISSFALLHRDYEILKEVNWAGVILDEAQNIKNPETKQARAARLLPADYRIALTGTPVENNVGDLWSIMEFLNPGFLGTQAEFKRSFFIPIQAERDPDAAARLKRLTGPFILRRLKTDKTIIADLPEKMEMKVFCTLTKEQASLYAAVVKDTSDALEKAQGIQRKGLVLATLSKLKQVCNHPAQFLGDNSAIAGRSGKLARLTEMLEEALSAGDRALIFSQFAEMGAIIQRHLQEAFGREALFLHGAVPKKQRDRMIERFQNEADGPRLFVLSLKAGGTGLNLTAANHVFHFDRWWNPAVENQATDRAFRIGQRRNVQVHKFLCAGTLEEKIDEMIERKQEIASSIVGTGESWLTELSTAELKDLFALRAEAIGE